eukprot:GHVU01056279.1.p1 GENE.GHVU01056279.1~~GHVU01056279.1.p1  ORF type:complete len:126 (+),score=2.58 GHVU01056279.1:346-723(+)
MTHLALAPAHLPTSQKNKNRHVRESSSTLPTDCGSAPKIRNQDRRQVINRRRTLAVVRFSSGLHNIPFAGYFIFMSMTIDIISLPDPRRQSRPGRLAPHSLTWLPEASPTETTPPSPLASYGSLL